MTFLALVFALLLAQVWSDVARVQTDDWYRGWHGLVTAWSVPPGLQLALAVLLPTAVAYVILDALAPVLFGLLWLGSAMLLLWYSLGRGDYPEQMELYRRQSRSGDFEGALLTVRTAPDTPDEVPASPEDVHDTVQEALLYQGFQRWFPVVLYFMVLGPAAALAYRLLQLSRSGPEAGVAERCLFLADWIPARLLAATFAVTGDFVGSREMLLDALQSGSRAAGELLYGVGAAAVGAVTDRDQDFGTWAAEQNAEFSGLLRRSAAAWLAVISLYVVLL